MLKSASAGFTDIWRVETIKDRHSQVMPPHDNHNPSLREMHALLQEMKTINDEGLHAPFDHQEGWLNDQTQRLKKWAGKKINKDFKTAQEKLEALFDGSSDQKKLLQEFLNKTKHDKDVFNTLKTLANLDELADIIAPGSSGTTKDAGVKMKSATDIYMKDTETDKRKKLSSILSKISVHDAFNSLKIVSAYRDDMLDIWKTELAALTAAPA
jgi:hypothetical protein